MPSRGLSIAVQITKPAYTLSDTSSVSPTGGDNSSTAAAAGSDDDLTLEEGWIGG